MGSHFDPCIISNTGSHCDPCIISNTGSHLPSISNTAEHTWVLGPQCLLRTNTPATMPRLIFLRRQIYRVHTTPADRNSILSLLRFEPATQETAIGISSTRVPLSLLEFSRATLLRFIPWEFSARASPHQHPPRCPHRIAGQN